jgi:hypothetical protein
MTTSETGMENRPANDLFCRQCGITLRPFMPVCPRCGTRRRATAKLVLPENGPRPQEGALGSLPLPTGEGAGAPLSAPNPLFSPEVDRRFPRFTSAQWTLLVLGLLLLLVGMIIAWLLWRQQQIDERLRPLSRAPGQGTGPALATPSPSPVGGPDGGSVAGEGQEAALAEASLLDAVQATLKAYNPFGYSRYRVLVKDGVVTLEGVVEHLPERTGAENVVRLVSGVNAVVNRLRVRAEEATVPSWRVDRAEAVLQEEALRQQQARTIIQGTGQGTGEGEAPAPSTEAIALEREAERLRRELMLARERAEELTRRQQAEAQRRRDLEESLRRQATREIPQQQNISLLRQGNDPPPELPLTAGSVAWSGVVDGTTEVLLAGALATVRTLTGEPVREARASFSAPLPQAPVTVRLLLAEGRGPITIVQQPAVENRFTTIVRLDDSQRGGARRYQFTLRWSLASP